MSDDHAHAQIPTNYEGEFEFTNGKLGMWLFLVSDAMAFIGFLGAYMVLRMSTHISGADDPLPWKPDWAPHLDLILTGLNTFVLIISSVTMVKALAAFQDGHIARGKTFLLGTIAGGSLFVGFQVWEWNHLIHEGVSMTGLHVPSLQTGMDRAKKNGSNATRLGMAKRLFGGREGADALPADFTEAQYVALPLKTIDPGIEDFRAKEPGVVHLAAYGIPATRANGARTTNRDELYAERRELEGAERAAMFEDQRKRGAKVANLFSASFFMLTGFHGLHVFIGVCYLWIIFFRARSGAYGPENNSPVEIAGLYWHFVDLVWVLLFMLIYLL